MEKTKQEEIKKCGDCEYFTIYRFTPRYVCDPTHYCDNEKAYNGHPWWIYADDMGFHGKGCDYWEERKGEMRKDKSLQ